MRESPTSFVSVERFAELTSLSTRSIQRLLRRGDLPEVRVGRRRLIPLPDGFAALAGRGRSRREGGDRR